MPRVCPLAFVLLAGVATARADDAVSLSAAPPVVVKTVPAGGSDGVDPGLTEIKVTYSKDMADGTWSWSTWGADTFPEMTGKPHYLKDKRTCVLPVRLRPGRTYATWLNSDNFGNFKDADGHPAVPYLLIFKTAGQPDAATRPAARAAATPGDLGPEHQVLLPGMALAADQPAGYANREVRPSPDGRYDAFLSTTGDECRVVVVDHQTGTQMVVPTPDERLMEARSVRHFGWDQGGQTLYVVEDGTTGVRTRARWERLTPEQLVDQVEHDIYPVLYRWTPGATTAPVVARLGGRVLALAGEDHGVWVVAKATDKSWEYVDLREFRDGKPAAVRSVHMRRDGQPVNYDWPQFLPGHNELWFASLSNGLGGPPSLDVIDLNAADPQARVVAKDVWRFAWSADEQRLVFPQGSGGERHDLCQLRRGSLDGPPTPLFKGVLTNGSSFQIAGISHDGRTLYLQGLAPAVGTTEHLTFDALRDGLRVYRLGLPM